MVRVDQRTESSVQFLDTARELEIFTIKKCVRFPKRYARYFSDVLIKLSEEIYNDLCRANATYLDSLSAFEQREYYVKSAEKNLRCLGSQLAVAKEIFDHIEKTDCEPKEKIPVCSSSAWVIWNKYILDELRLLANLRRSDKDRKNKFITQ